MALTVYEQEENSCDHRIRMSKWEGNPNQIWCLGPELRKEFNRYMAERYIAERDSLKAQSQLVCRIQPAVKQAGSIKNNMCLAIRPTGGLVMRKVSETDPGQFFYSSKPQNSGLKCI